MGAAKTVESSFAADWLSPAGVGHSLLKGPPKRKKPPDAPEPPGEEISLAQRRARDRMRERAMRTPANQLTGPSGLTTEATTAPKTLLGA